MVIDKLHEGVDQIYNKHYSLCSINAIELSSYLKSNITNISDYVIHNSYVDNSIDIISEIYEYQNFFLIKKDGEYLLLDGFRRLLIFQVPDININVRIYKYEDFNSFEILRLLINLNHTKFIGNLGFYYDRGVCLALDKLFGINISKYHKSVDGYLRQDETKRSYTRNSYNNDLLIDRLLNPYFIDDMKFIQSLSDLNIVLLNDIFGTLVYNFRITNPDLKLDSSKFISLVNNDDSISQLMDKIYKYKDNGSAKSIDVVNKLTDSYIKIFDILAGKKVEKTYNEKIIEFKDTISKFKKNKKYSKLTKSRDTLILENIILANLKNNIKNNYKLFIHPNETDEYNIGYGLVEYDIILKIDERTSYSRDSSKFHLYIIIDNKEYKINHGYSEYGRGQTYIKFNMWDSKKTIHNKTYVIELFVDISETEFKEAKIKQYGS